MTFGFKQCGELAQGVQAYIDQHHEHTSTLETRLLFKTETGESLAAQNIHSISAGNLIDLLAQAGITSRIQIDTHLIPTVILRLNQPELDRNTRLIEQAVVTNTVLPERPAKKINASNQQESSIQLNRFNEPESGIAGK